MNLYKNGYVVADINNENSAYNAWPLSELKNDTVAEQLTDDAYEIWFYNYDMHHIIPDVNYIKTYQNYCNSIDLQTKILLFESPDNNIVIDDTPEIIEELGFDCLGTVYFSYLQSEYNDFKPELTERKIFPNKHGLFDKLEYVLYYIELRQKDIASGINLEDFWEELPVRISVVDIS